MGEPAQARSAFRLRSTTRRRTSGSPCIVACPPSTPMRIDQGVAVRRCPTRRVALPTPRLSQPSKAGRFGPRHVFKSRPFDPTIATLRCRWKLPSSSSTSPSVPHSSSASSRAGAHRRSQGPSAASPTRSIRGSDWPKSSCASTCETVARHGRSRQLAEENTRGDVGAPGRRQQSDALAAIALPNSRSRTFSGRDGGSRRRLTGLVTAQVRAWWAPALVPPWSWRALTSLLPP